MQVATVRDVTLKEEYLLKLWDNYIQDNLVESTPCKVAIYDLRSGALIVASDKFYLLQNEMCNITEGMKYPNVAYKNGITIQNHYYRVHLADGKTGIYAKDGLNGCTVCKTWSFLIVGVHDHRVQSDVCNEQVMRLGDYFRKLGL
ncbi:hypothetical protein ACF0H5_004966 [Mactra antiquata]